MADAHEPCQCPNCVAMHPDPGERLWIAYAKLARRIQRERPGKKVMLTSYGATGSPPRSLKELPDNVVIQMCGYQADDFDGWNKFNVEKTVYIYDWCKVGGAPGRDRRTAADSPLCRRAGATLRQNKVRGIYFCGGQELQGLEGPVYYVYGKMLGNPELHYAELADDFYRAAYGKARAPMTALFNAMHQRLEASSAVCLSSNVSFRTEAEPGYVDEAITPEDWFCHYFPPKLVSDMEKNLQRAKALAATDDDPTVMKRIRRVEFDFNYLKNLADIFALYRDLPCEAELGDVRPAGRRGPEAQCVPGRLVRRAGPFQGGVRRLAALLRRHVQGGDAGQRQLPRRTHHVEHQGHAGHKKFCPAWMRRRRRSPGSRGSSSAAAWTTRPGGASRPRKSRESTWAAEGPATFKLAYDERNFYVGFECSFDRLEEVETQPMGRDGRCWRGECVELVLDPAAAGEVLPPDRQPGAQFLLQRPPGVHHRPAQPALPGRGPVLERHVGISARHRQGEEEVHDRDQDPVPDLGGGIAAQGHDLGGQLRPRERRQRRGPLVAQPGGWRRLLAACAGRSDV